MMGEPSSVLMAANRSPGQNCSRIVLRMLVWSNDVLDRCAQEAHSTAPAMSRRHCAGGSPWPG